MHNQLLRVDIYYSFTPFLSLLNTAVETIKKYFFVEDTWGIMPQYRQAKRTAL